jgi:hypothetical protein
MLKDTNKPIVWRTDINNSLTEEEKVIVLQENTSEVMINTGIAIEVNNLLKLMTGEDTTKNSIKNMTTKISISSEMTTMISEDMFIQMKSIYGREVLRAAIGLLITDNLQQEILLAKESIVANVI